ncbi:MAG: (2Fe-2S)-binding protein [Magnetospirillum sp.]|nr:(2Fe-2S)-binding protein [Magnetospirillum sp.]
MYVCLCHGFTDRQVKCALEAGAGGSTAAVYRHFECAPRCGKCVPLVRDMVRAARTDEEPPVRR